MRIAVDNAVPSSLDDPQIIELMAHARSLRADPASGLVLLVAACRVLGEHFGAAGAEMLVRNSLEYLCKHGLLGLPLDEGGGNGIV